MRQFVIRTLNLILIVFILVCYQQHANDRAEVVAAHEAEEKEAAELEKKYAQMLADAQKDADEASAEDDSGYKDGVYEGTGSGFGGDIKVSVTIENHEITKVEILSAEQEDPEYLGTASALLDQITEEQTADLDTVSGATFSSTGILAAASEALDKAQ